MADPSTSATQEPQARWPAWCEIALIVIVFYLHAGWLAPDINEPHYLSKARHYWDPTWCQNDFFCNTADAHQVFYWTFGWVTRWLSLAATAWVGRVLVWTLIACGWYRLSTALVAAPLVSVLSAALFVMFNDHCQMAGEWVVGGIEAKGFSYALVFGGLGEMLRNRWTRGWLLLGAATAFHVLVGGWALVAAAIMWAAAARERPPLRQTLLAGLGALALAAPGLWPVLRLAGSVPSEMMGNAYKIYVFDRLDHHLVFRSFLTLAPGQPLWSLPIVHFGLLLIGWLALLAFGPNNRPLRRLAWFVAGSLGIAAVGALIDLSLSSNQLLAAQLLRFYWFRLADAMLPAGVALASVNLIHALRLQRRWQGTALLCAALLAVAVHLGDIVAFRWEYPSPRAFWNTEIEPRDWWDICAWISENTPEDAVFLTPASATTFRWYTNRSEVVNKKDVPQDPAGLLAWNQRLADLHQLPAEEGVPIQWRGTLANLGAEQLIELGHKYGADYVLTSTSPQLPLKKVSPPNAGYAVYKLPPAKNAQPSNSP